MRSEHSFGNRIFLTEGRIIVQTKGQAKEKTIKKYRKQMELYKSLLLFSFPQRTKESGRFSHCAHSNEVNLYAH